MHEAVVPAQTGQPSRPSPEGTALDEEQQVSLSSEMTLLDWSLVTILTIFLFLVCAARSRTHLFWADELVSNQIFRDPSFSHMLRAWTKGADSGGLVFYLSFPIWRLIFGLSEISLRLFSTAGFSVGLALLWFALRRYFSTLPLALAIYTVFLTAPVMLWQEINGRFYGLFFASACFAGLMFLLLSERSRPTRVDLFLLGCAQACLIGSHVLGLVYSFSLICGLVALDVLHHRIRWSVYLSALAGWLILPISLPAIRATSSVAVDVFWTAKPTLTDFWLALSGYGHLTGLLLAVCLSIAVFLLLFKLRRSGLSTLRFFYSGPAALVWSLLLAASILFIKSQSGISIFADRYLLPLCIITVVLMAACFGTLLSAFGRFSLTPSRTALVTFLLFVPFGAYAATRNPNYLLYPQRGYAERVARLIPKDAPVVTTLPLFYLLNTYDTTHRYLFITNWAYDLAPGHKADYSGERLMENWSRAGYLSDQILPCTTIFGSYTHTYFLVEGHLAPWFSERVLTSSNYRVVLLAHIREWDYADLWSVERIGPGTLPC